MAIPRHPIGKFAMQMEDRLVEKDDPAGTRGWRTASPEELVGSLHLAAGRLSMSTANKDNEEMIKYATDVANYAMMMRDVIEGGTE